MNKVKEESVFCQFILGYVQPIKKIYNFCFPILKMTTRSVLSPKLGGGPHGLGDPDDKSLRRVEMDVLIPKKMRDIARDEKCVDVVAAFTECCKENGFLMVIKCRSENCNLKECLTKWYNDADFKEHCKNLYLKERSDYRRTGIPTKTRLPQFQRVGSNM